MEIQANAKKYQENSSRFIRKYVKFRLLHLVHYNPPLSGELSTYCPLESISPVPQSKGIQLQRSISLQVNLA
jgi:hypothetical protein